MPNTNVLTGADASITLAGPQGPEGERAQQVIDAYQLTPVGRATGVQVEIASDLKPFHEIGQRYPTELRPGNVNISGSIGRAYINGALLTLLLGDAATSRPANSWVQPAFNITLLLENAAIPGNRSTVTIHQAMFQNWSFQIPEDDFVLESVRFRALFISVQDEEAA
ncbi:MAG TPA: hypothetical protein VNK05_10195 [Chloroflexota bacterium]|jgi:hypothetical protein|nr:hypothetical protein [Chloroflexota bacterium]